MARTVGNLLTQAREILNDSAGERYTTAQLVSYLNDAVQEARSLRPDLFIGAYDVPIVDLTASDTAEDFPLTHQFFVAAMYYVTGRAELRDDEFAVDGRAMTLMQALKSKLVQGM